MLTVAHPFNNWEMPVLDMLLRSGSDYRYQALRGNISHAKLIYPPMENYSRDG